MEKTISSLLNDPLFSTIITLYLLIFLYFPTLFLPIVFSPLLISTSILLFSLLRLGAIQRTKNQREKINPISAELDFTVDDSHDRKWVHSKPDQSSENGSDFDFCDGPTSSFCADSFVEWDVRAPLEVIYEEYEGQEDDEDDALEGRVDAQMAFIERYASLSKFFPETDDSDTSSEEDFPAIRDWNPPERLCFRWEGEDRDGLIEIALEGKGYSDGEEENLIEIDLSQAR